MSEIEIIKERKKLFGLPLQENEVEFWGPIDYDFSDSFLNMGNAFLSSYSKLGYSKRKKFFTAFVELVQNIAKYNETETENNYSHSFVNLKMLDDKVSLVTANQIDAKHVEIVNAKFKEIFSTPKDKLPEKYKTALMNGESLGLVMVRSLEDSTLEWDVVKEGEENWLIFKLQMSYG